MREDISTLASAGQVLPVSYYAVYSAADRLTRNFGSIEQARRELEQIRTGETHAYIAGGVRYFYRNRPGDLEERERFICSLAAAR